MGEDEISDPENSLSWLKVVKLSILFQRNEKIQFFHSEKVIHIIIMP